MKKQLILMVTFATAVVCLVGCGKKKSMEPEESFDSSVVAEINKPQEETWDLKFYYGDQNAEFLLCREDAVPVTNNKAQSLITQLKDMGVLDAAVTLNKASDNSKKELSLDFNMALQEQLEGQGTAGEWIVVGSIVNTFLTNMGDESVLLTVEGKPLETGHETYEEALQAFPLYQEAVLNENIKVGGKKKQVELYRECTSLGFAFDYDHKTFRKIEEEGVSLSFASKKLDDEGHPLASLEISKLEKATALEAANQMVEDKKLLESDAFQEYDDSEIIAEVVFGADKSLSGTRVVTQFGKDGTVQECYYFFDDGDQTWQVYYHAQSENDQKRLDLTVNSLSLIR